MKAIMKSGRAKQIYIQVYDMENEIGQEIELNLSIIKLEGMSQLNLNNYLYLCGHEHYTNEHEAAKFIKIDPLKQPANVSFLISCSYCHYYPSMTYMRNEFIIVIGGKNTLKCEMFNKLRCKWIDLVDLPEERYGAILSVDEVTQSLYLFGGYNSTSKKINSSILKLNLKQGRMERWETIITMSTNAVFLTKCYSCVCRVDPNKVLIIGGKNNLEEDSLDIIECSFNKTSIVINNRGELDIPSSFKSTNFCCEYNGNLFLFDDRSTIHKLSKFELKHSSSSFFEIVKDHPRNGTMA
jgi:hypothetical protein